MKQGQSVTFFIIIGILMILLVSVGIFFSGEEQKLQFEEGVTATIEQVPQEAQPVFSFIETCIRQVGEQGLRKMGTQGGYLDTSEFKINPLDMTEGNSLAYTYPAEFKIPYWYAMEPPNNCEKTGGCSFTSYRPNLYRSEGEPSIEGQLSTYIERNLKECVTDFSGFKIRGIDLSIKKDPVVDARIGVEDVSIVVNMPVVAKTPSGEHRLDSYFTRFDDVNIKRIYELGTNISSLQAYHNFLEKGTYNLISLYGGIDAPLPPVAKTEIKFGSSKYWVKREVKRTIKEHILTPYIPMLQVFGTKNYKPIEEEEGALSTTKKLLYNRGMLVPISYNQTYPELTATFSYLPIWEPYFDLNCDGQLCNGMSGSTMILILFGIQRYQFAYDLSYPVLTTITQPEAFDGRGYTLQFGLEANIRNNEPMNPGTELFDPSELLGDVLPNHPFGDVEQRNSGVFTINVFSGKTELAEIPIPAEGAHISFHCQDESVALGIAENGTKVTRLPRCIDGVIDARRQEGGNGVARVNSFSDQDQEINITIEDYRVMDFSFSKIKMDRVVEVVGDPANDPQQLRYTWIVDPTRPRVPLRDWEEATVIMKKQPDFEGEDPFTIVSSIYGSKSTKIDHCSGGPKQDLSEDIKMLPGRYETQVIVMSYQDIKILPETRVEGNNPMVDIKGIDHETQDLILAFVPGGWIISSKFAGLLGETEIDLPGVDFNCSTPLIIANYNLNITFPPAYLDQSDNIDFGAITFEFEDAPEPERKIEELEVMGNTEHLNRVFKKYIRPRFQLKDTS